MARKPKTRTTTTKQLKAGQPAPTGQTFSARRSVPRADEVVSTARSAREHHEAANAAAVAEGLEATGVRTRSMDRRPHGDGDGSQPRPDGGAGGAVSD
jgi:hypothetical protein